MPSDLLELLQSNPALAKLLRGSAQGAIAPSLGAALGGPPGMLLSLLPIIMSLFGGDPQADMRRKAEKLSSPQHLIDIQQKLLRMLGATPENVANRAGIVNQSTSLANSLSQSLSARGLGTTGIAAVAQPIARSAVGGRLANFEGALSAGAMNNARGMVDAELQALQGYPLGQSRLQGGIDKSLSALLPAIGDYYKNRYRAPVARIG